MRARLLLTTALCAVLGACCTKRTRPPEPEPEPGAARAGAAALTAGKTGVWPSFRGGPEQRGLLSGQTITIAELDAVVKRLTRRNSGPHRCNGVGRWSEGPHCRCRTLTRLAEA